jgi:membrane-bound serine protease (ClpP class)
MTRPSSASLRGATLVVLGLALLRAPARGQQDQAPATSPGQFFTVVEPINGDVRERIQSATLPLLQQKAARPTLVFEFRPGDAEPGKSPFGESFELEKFIAHDLAGAQTVAYVPQPLSGYAVLAALACDDIVLGSKASLGPITPEGKPVTAVEREAVRTLADRKGRDADLLLGMLDPDAELLEVRTADRQTHFVLKEHLAAFRKSHQVIDERPAWEGGRRGVLVAERARGTISKLFADDRNAIKEAYHLDSTSDDPTSGGKINPVLIRIEGPIDQVKESYLARRIKQAKQEQANLIIFDIDSPGGVNQPADTIADAIAHLKEIKTVAYIDDRATGVTALVALACDEIVFHKGSRMGEATAMIVGGSNEDLDDRMLKALAERAADIAAQKGHPAAVARAMVDPKVKLATARDAKTGAVTFVTEEQLRDDPARYQKQDDLPKPEGEALTVTAETARQFGMATLVVDDLEKLKAAYGIRGNLRVDGPTWVDSLVTLLNTPWMSWLLLFVGMFMLILELKLPGVGLPAITSALAFLLFFWGHYLGGTADQLEILLFLVGLVCLALELFVFPGFGVFGMSGILLILVSVVMASHTFIWPTQDYEYRQMGRTLMQVTLAIIAVAAGAMVLGRYFPSLPLFNRMVLQPEPPVGPEPDPTGKPPLDPDAALFFLVGEVGRTTTALRPSGKARFGELLVDVTADGFYIEADAPVEVVEVRGARVLVKRA